MIVPKGIAKKFHSDWTEYTAELSERNQKHFTLYHARTSNLPEELNEIINIDTETEIFTNGRFFYTLDKNKKAHMTSGITPRRSAKTAAL